jgi:hypothetical protein
MTYKNEKLNIIVESLENAAFFSITEHYDRLDLLFENELRFTIYHDSRAFFRDSSILNIHGKSIACACGKSTVYAYGESTVHANDKSKVYANEKSTVYASEESTVYAYHESKVYAYDKTKVYAYDESKVYAHGESRVSACEFSCIYVKSIDCNIVKENHFGAIIEQVFVLDHDMEVYKKLKGNKIATLLLKKGQGFQSKNHNKCRTNEAFVVSIKSTDKRRTYKKGISMHDSSFIYRVGETVKPDFYDNNIEECSGGIHFFLTREKAENYSY